MPQVGLSKPPVTSTSWLPLLCVAHRQMLEPSRRVDKLGRVQLSTCLQVGEVVKFAVLLAAHGDVKHIYPRAPEHDEQHVRQGGGIRSYRERTRFFLRQGRAHTTKLNNCATAPTPTLTEPEETAPEGDLGNRGKTSGCQNLQPKRGGGEFAWISRIQAGLTRTYVYFRWQPSCLELWI